MQELSTHLFIITDVQYDRATSQKFFKCSFKLYPADTDNIYSHVVGKYVYDPSGNGNGNGVGDSVLITEEASAAKNAVMELRDGLIDKFEELFYDEGMDTFAYQKPLDRSGNNFEYYWSPYVCHFIYKNKVLEKSHRDFLTEIFVQDYNEREYPAIYSEKGYRGTLFHAVEQCDINLLDKYCSFMEVSAYDLNKPLNLPFFTTAEKFHLIDVNHPYNIDFWLGAFDWINATEDTLITSQARFTLDKDESLEDAFIGILDASGLITNTTQLEDGTISRGISDTAVGKTLYFTEYSNSTANSVTQNAPDYIIKIDRTSDDDTIAHPVDLKSVLQGYNSNEYSSFSVMFKIIGGYLADNLTLTQENINTINETYYENNLQTYILLPILIYVLQNYKGE
jgi:hypothetical protein